MTEIRTNQCIHQRSVAPKACSATLLAIDNYDVASVSNGQTEPPDPTPSRPPIPGEPPPGPGKPPGPAEPPPRPGEPPGPKEPPIEPPNPADPPITPPDPHYPPEEPPPIRALNTISPLPVRRSGRTLIDE